ncbi:MAG: DUF1292 domain-containing protein [Bacilli bacterium]
MGVKNQILQKDSIITLINDEGKDISFHMVAGINHEHDYYVIVEPLSKYSDIKENSLVIYKVLDEEVSNKSFELVIDKEIILEVFKKYEKLLELEKS